MSHIRIMVAAVMLGLAMLLGAFLYSDARTLFIELGGATIRLDR